MFAQQKSERQIVHELFERFDEILIKKSDCVYSTNGGPYSVHLWPTPGNNSFSASEKKEFQLFRFKDGITILRGVHKLEGVASRRASGYPECAHASWKRAYEWKEYIVFENGDALNVISDEKKILETIRKATGISLPKLDTRIVEGEDEEDAAHYPHEVIRTEVKSDKDLSYYFNSYDGPFWEDPTVVVFAYHRKEIATLQK